MVPSFYFRARRRNYLRGCARFIERLSRLDQLRLFKPIGYKNCHFLSLKITVRHDVFSMNCSLDQICAANERGQFVFSRMPIDCSAVGVKNTAPAPTRCREGVSPAHTESVPSIFTLELALAALPPAFALIYIGCLMPSTGERFERAVAIMERLRAPGGCPWDREQTFDSIKPYTLEETYEVLEAI